MKKEFKVGDKVFSEQNGDGKVISSNDHKAYPILVFFEDGMKMNYTEDGFLYINRSDQSNDLHHRDEPARKLVDPNTTTGCVVCFHPNDSLPTYRFAGSNYTFQTNDHYKNMDELIELNLDIHVLVDSKNNVLWERSKLSSEIVKPDCFADAISHIDSDGVELIANKRMINDDLKPQPMAMKEVYKPEFNATCKLCGSPCNKTLYRGKMLPWCGDCK